MPRGNDTAYATEFNANTMSQYGIHSNAEEMIADHRARLDPALSKASLMAINEEETAKANEDLDAVGKKFDVGDDEIVLGATVRGNAVIAVIEDANGFTRKELAGWTDDYKAPKLTAQEKAVRAQWEKDNLVRQETTRLRAEADAKIAEVEAEENARVAEEIAKIRENADKQLAKEVERNEKLEAKEAAKDAAKDDSGAGGTAAQS
jgi:hypothetical protein